MKVNGPVNGPLWAVNGLWRAVNGLWRAVNGLWRAVNGLWRDGHVSGFGVMTAATLVLAYLCAGELLPQPVRTRQRVFRNWATQEVVLVGVLCILTVGLGTVSRGGVRARLTDRTAAWLLGTLNCVPIVAAAVFALFDKESDNCPTAPQEPCDQLAIQLDTVGLISARVARLDLALCLLLSARGESAWLKGATSGRLGYAEGIPMHRLAGWWCAGQSGLHSIAYAVFYLETGGARSLWVNCFPAPLPDGRLNRLGLVNWLGVLAFAALLLLVLPARQRFRHCSYHIFQRLHLPVAVLFVMCCALHDLPILLFALPGITTWYLGSRGTGVGTDASVCGSRLRLPAQARLLPGTSGPWVELTFDYESVARRGGCPAPRGQWVLLRAVKLGPERHPLSLTLSDADTRGTPTELSVVVSARAGDWSRALAALAQPPVSTIEVEVDGPYNTGGGTWSLREQEGHHLHSAPDPARLLLAGGTGVTGWLPELAAGGTSRGSQLVWCVQTEQDYLALAARLPRKGVTVFVTRASPAARILSAAAPPLSKRAAAHNSDGGVCVKAVSQSPGVGGRSMAPVSLMSTLVGLAVGYWGWDHVAQQLDLPRVSADEGWLHQTLIGYTVSRRYLPILLIIVAAVFTTAVGCSIFEHASSGRWWPCGTTEMRSATPRRRQERLFTGETSTAERQVQGGLDETEDPEDASRGHHVRAGRPDFDGLVRAVAKERGTRRLVVAACGPPALVEAAREAVAVVRKECPDSAPTLEFSGGDPRW